MVVCTISAVLALLSQIIVSEACFGEGDLAAPLNYPNPEGEYESCSVVKEMECGKTYQTMQPEACSEQGEYDVVSPQSASLCENKSCDVVNNHITINEIEYPVQCSSDNGNSEICKLVWECSIVLSTVLSLSTVIPETRSPLMSTSYCSISPPFKGV